MEKSIVNIIKDLCEENSISIGDLEKNLSFSQGLISRWDKNSPSIDKVLSVSEFFQVSTDYLLGRIQAKQSTKLENSFLEKLLIETENYNLNWKEYSEQFISKKNIENVFTNIYYIIDDGKYLGDIEHIYELEYNSSCIYLICAEYDYVFSVFVVMQTNKHNDSAKDNFVPISTYLDFDKTKNLEYKVSSYLSAHKVRDKSKIIMRNFLNNTVSSEFPDEPIPYSHIVNNMLVNQPGFVLDARVGKQIMDTIFEIQKRIDLLEQK